MNEVQSVNGNAGILDSLQSAGRALVLIISAVPVLAKLIGAHDFAGLVAYFQGSTGATLIAAVGALFVIGQGIYKAHKRGSQVVSAVPYTPHLELKN